MSQPTATWKVTIPSPGEDNGPAVVWRGSEDECEAWIASRSGREPAQALLDYGYEGPLAPVAMTVAVIDRLRAPGEGRVVERFADAGEARAWVRNERRIEALDPNRGDYDIVAAVALPAALSAPAIQIRRGGALRQLPPSSGESAPRLSGLERSTVPRILATALGGLEVRAYPDGHLRVSAGTVPDAGCTAPSAPMADGNRLSFEAIVRLDGESICSRGIRYELRDADELPVADPAAHRAAVDSVREAVRSAINGHLDEYPRDRDEALERHLQVSLNRIDSERRVVQARLRELDRNHARAEELLSSVRAKLADDPEAEAEAEAHAPGM